MSLVAALLAGCAGVHKRGTSRIDEYDAVQVDQMVGNNVTRKVFEKTILCLNARRETRTLHTITNQTVRLLTNTTLVSLTNQTITLVTNQSQTLATNQTAPLIAAQATVAATNELAPSESPPLIIPSAQPASITNQAVTTANNLTFSKAQNQLVTTANYQTYLSRQITTTTNNLSITTADNQSVSTETNFVVTTLTNQSITALTNPIVTLTNLALREYYLYVELTPPPDFALQTGESLALLIDGVRHGFAPANSQTAFVPRRGFTSYLYKVPPEVLVNVANAQQVKIRLKGINSVIEREMSRSSRQNFKKFLVKYFAPQSTSPTNLSVSALISTPVSQRN